MSVVYKELTELLDGAELAKAHVGEIMADGKIDLRDLPVLIKISGSLAKYNAAFQGLDKITLEGLGEITPDEVEDLVTRIVKLIGVSAPPVTF